MEAPVPTSTGAPEVFIIQTMDLQVRQVSRSLMSTGEWWRTKFPSPSSAAGAVHFQLKPVREYMGLPVFTLDIPAGVLDAVLDMLRVPELCADYWNALPLALEGKYTLTAWRGYMREYGFRSDKRTLDDDSEDEDAPPLKKARTLSPYDMKLQRVAVSFHAYIFAGHPKAEHFRNGIVDEFTCAFITRYLPCTTGPYTFRFTHDELVDSEIYMGWFLKTKLSHEQTELFLHVLEELSPPGTSVTAYVLYRRDEKSRVKTLRSASEWPLSPDGREVSFSVQHHELVCLTFSYKSDK